MITVTRMNETPLVVNADLIEFVESVPETNISLITGKKLMVRETVADVIHRVTEFKQQCGVQSATPVGTHLQVQGSK